MFTHPTGSVNISIRTSEGFDVFPARCLSFLIWYHQWLTVKRLACCRQQGFVGQNNVTKGFQQQLDRMQNLHLSANQIFASYNALVYFFDIYTATGRCVDVILVSCRLRFDNERKYNRALQ